MEVSNGDDISATSYGFNGVLFTFVLFFFVFSRRWAGFKHRPGFQHRDSQWQSTFKASRFTMICIRVPIQ